MENEIISENSKRKIKELFRYGIAGFSTTLINLITYHVLILILDYKIANLIALIVSKTYGYFANKAFVFKSKTGTLRSWVTEVLKFIAARGFTAVVDYFGLIFAVEVLGWNSIVSKYLIQIVVIIMNYILGKYVVFNGNRGTNENMTKDEVQKYNTGNLDKYQSKNSLKRKMVEMLHNRMIEIIRQELCQQSEDSLALLDAGCGEGFFTGVMKKELPNARIVGCDGAEEALNIAEEQVSGVVFDRANLYELPYKDREFDLVVCSEVLEHLSDPSDAFAELCRVGKKILITVPHEPWFRLGNLLALHNVTRLGDPIDHINHWTFSGFKKFVKDQGMVIKYSFGRSFPWSIFWGETDQ